MPQMLLKFKVMADRDAAQVYSNAANTGSGAGKLITTSSSYNKLLEMI